LTPIRQTKTMEGQQQQPPQPDLATQRQPPADIPPWLASFMEAQNNLSAKLAESQHALLERLAVLEAQNQQPQFLSPAQETPFASTNPSGLHTPVTRHQSPALEQDEPHTTKRPKQRLGEVAKFDGKDKAKYREFSIKMAAKLEIDGEAIGDEKTQVWYAYSGLTGEAESRIFPWVETTRGTPQFTLRGLHEQMDLAFLDPRARQKAIDELNRIKQRSRPFADFLNTFDTLILEAQGWSWSDEVKKAFLKAAVSERLLDRMVAVETHPTYVGYCAQLRRTSDQIEERDEYARRKKNWNRLTTTRASHDLIPADPMEWETTTTKVAATSSAQTRTRADWLTKEEFIKRQEAGICTRCKSKDHDNRQCHLLPPRRPERKTRPTRAAVTTIPAKEEEGDTDASSGNE
jgi:hypothetical protein